MGTPRILGADELDVAATILREGGLVAFPTETVYGLGAHARDSAAVRRVFAAKGRPADNPLIVHLADPHDLPDVAREVPPSAAGLAARFWPGPLTLVLDAVDDLPAVTTGGHPTVGVRVPDHPVALRLLAAAGVPVAAPSANRSGRPSPTTAAHVVADLGDRVDAVVDGGPAGVGLESTVVDARTSAPIVLREGAVTREDLSASAATGTAAAPGTRYRHYAPSCRLELCSDVVPRAAALAGQGLRVGAIVAADAQLPAEVQAIGRYRDLEELARGLYAGLRAAEELGVDVLVAPTVPEHGIGRAVMDRLRRAAAL